MSGPDEEPSPGEPAEQAAAKPSRSIATLPDLRQYYDIRRLADYKPRVIEAGRRSGPALLRMLRALARCAARTLLRSLRVLTRGGRVLLGLLADWLSGSIGSRGSVLARLGIAGGAAYAVIRMSMLHPASLWAVAAALLAVTTLAGLGRLPIPGAEPEATAAPEGPAEPPLTALLRELIGDANGVHLGVLRPAMRDRLPGLSGASDKQLSDLLVEAGYDPTRKFRAGGIAGRAGVRRSQLPPLSPTGAPGPLSAPGERPRPANSPAAESGGGRPERGVRYVRDPEYGPTAWRIEHDE